MHKTWCISISIRLWRTVYTTLKCILKNPKFQFTYFHHIAVINKPQFTGSWLNDCVSQYLSTSFRPWEEPFSLPNITSPETVQISSRHLKNKTQLAYPRGQTITAKEPVGCGSPANAVHSGGSPANAVHSSHLNFGSAERQSETSWRLCTVSVDRHYGIAVGMGLDSAGSGYGRVGETCKQKPWNFSTSWATISL